MEFPKFPSDFLLSWGYLIATTKLMDDLTNGIKDDDDGDDGARLGCDMVDDVPCQIRVQARVISADMPSDDDRG